MCASNTPCLDDSGQCTSRCIPLAASWCQGLCPNAMQYVPSTNPVSAQIPIKCLAILSLPLRSSDTFASVLSRAYICD